MISRIELLRHTYKRFQKPIKELLQVGSGQFLTALGGLLGVRLLTYVMVPARYGELALAMTFFTLIQQIIMGPVTNSIARYFTIAHEKGSIKSYLESVTMLLKKSTGTTIICFAIVLIGLLVFRLQQWIALLFYTFLFTLVSSYNIALDNIQNAARQRIVVAWHQVLSQWLRYLLAVGFILLFGSTSGSAMIGYLLAASVVILSQWYFLKRNSFFQTKTIQFNQDSTSSADWERQMILFALPFAIWGIFTWAQMSSDRWALQVFKSTSVVGLYSVLYQVGYYPIMLLTGVFVQFISPILYRRVGDGREYERVLSTQQLTNKIVNSSIGFTCLLTVVAWNVKDLVFRLLVAPQYRDVSYLLPAMVLSGGLFASGQISALTALNNNQPSILMKPKIITSLLGLAMNFAGAYFYGINGVVGAGILFGLIFLVWIYWLFRE